MNHHWQRVALGTQLISAGEIGRLVESMLSTAGVGGQYGE
jgi:hypothetical protein